MTTFKKILALAMALIMVFALVACGETPAPTTTNGGNVQNPTGNQNPDPQPTDPKNPVSGEKRVITIGVWWDFYYDSTHASMEDNPSYQGTLSDQMMFDVVKIVEEKYNVEFQYVNMTYTGVTESINTSILAGTPECDIYLCELAFGIPAALNGLAIDLRTVLGEDADIFNEQNVMSYLDLGDGKACLMKQVLGQNVVEATYPLAFNKQLLEDANLEDPRDLYERGEWTWDKFIEYCKKLTKDTDGDGVNDQFGFTGFKEDVMAQLIMSNGGAIASGKTEGLTSTPVGEALAFYADMYNVHNVCAPYPAEDNGDVTRFQYRDGNIAFWPGAAWIASSNGDYDLTSGSALEFDTVYVQWPVGPSGSKETNKGKTTAGSFWFIPTGTKDPELVYNVFYELSNWYRDDISIRDDVETMWWWYSITAKDEQLMYDNYDVMFDVGSREQFDIYQSLQVMWDLEALINGTMTASQFQETYKNEFQAALDAYFG